MRVKLAEWATAAAAVCATFLACEAAFSLLGLRYVPLRLHGDLPANVRVFAQSSKAGVVPRSPILLLGDSYAQGSGDWLLDADPDRNEAFHSAHVVHSLSGRDVITLGIGGAGSVEGLAAAPAVAYARSKRAWYLRLPMPSVAVVYFYEGNDLNNNLTFIEEVAAVVTTDIVGPLDRAIAADPSAFLEPASWRRHFPLLRFLKGVVRRRYAEVSSNNQARELEPTRIAGATPPDHPTIVKVAEEAVLLPANLQSPAMELTPVELQRAVLVYERSLASLRSLLPRVPLLVVHLPSPLSTYELVGPEVSIARYVEGRATRYSTERVAQDSDRICLMIRAATIAHGSGFLDLRSIMRAAGRRELLHGPRDFKHFNRKGMEVLGRAVAERIDSPLIQAPCSQMAQDPTQ